jgi:predicted metal-dependent hydrolase
MTQEKKIRVKSETITYTMKTARRSTRIRVIVHPGGAVVLSRPRWATVKQAESFLLEKIDWVLRNVRIMRERPSFLEKGTQEEYLRLKDDVLQLVLRRLEHFNQIYGFEYQKVSIRNQKSRWGSCSRQGNLSFNYRLGLLPDHCADYIIVHELCHLKEFNHSERFWDLVAQTIPNHREIRQEINQLS